MKKSLCMLLTLALLLCAACAETVQIDVSPAAEIIEATQAPESAEPVTLGFEDGFALELPAGWQYYPVNAEMAEQGVLYCLSDAEAARWLYIQSWTADCADIQELEALIAASAPQTSGVYSFNGMDFVIYDLSEGDVSCCAALLDGRVLNFVFTPQSDAEYMGAVTQIIGSFSLLEK